MIARPHTDARTTAAAPAPPRQFPLIDDATNESPLARAKRIRFSLEFKTFSQGMQIHIARVAAATTYPPQLAEMLDREHASFKVCRWVAEGKYLQDRVVRFALALLMRKEAPIDNPRRAAAGWVWPKDHLHSAAEKLFWKSPQCERLIRAGVLSQGIPADGKHLFNTMWVPTWAAIQRDFATIDREKFLAQVHAVAAQRRRRRARKRLKLTDEQRAFIGAFDVIKRGLIGGRITLEDASQALQSPPAPNKKRKT